MPKHNLSRKAVKEISAAIDELFNRAKTRFLGPQSVESRIQVSYQHPLSLPGVFEAAATEEGAKPNVDTLNGLIDIADSYLDAVKGSAKAKTLAEIRQFLSDASVNGIDTDWKTVLGGKIADLWGDITSNVERIITSETATAKNVSVLDGIIKVNQSVGIEDPVVYFIVVHDGALCNECKRLHLLPDEVTPRVWKVSELGHGYHKKGEDNPKLGGLHPHCRCVYDGSAPVLTERGTVSLKNVVVGDRVLTHTGKFKRVLSTFGKYGIPSNEDLFRVEFKTPQDRIHKLRVTGDHLLLTQRGWVRADGLEPSDSLQYLFKECEYCHTPFPHDIKKPNKRFCSVRCVGSSHVGKPGPAKGRVVGAMERERRTESIRVTNEEKNRSGTLTSALTCSVCHSPFTWQSAYRSESGRWIQRYKIPDTCSRSCHSKRLSAAQWESDKHRVAVSNKNRESMLEQYRSGARTPAGIEKARKALYANGGGPSKDQRSLFDLVKSQYMDAELEYRIGKYFGDIAIPSVKTVIEWDGGGHWMDVYKGKKTREQKEDEDRLRDEYMHSQGWHVLRYSEESGSASVLTDIRRVALNSMDGYTFQSVPILRVVKVPKGKVSRLARLYDITVEDDASFVIQGIVSHNCTMVTLMQGYGFTNDGMVTYISPKHDELKAQRNGKKLQKYEDDLIKGLRFSELADYMKPFGWKPDNKGIGGHPTKLVHESGRTVPIQQKHLDGVMDDQMVRKYSGQGGLKFIRQPRPHFKPNEADPVFLPLYQAAGHVEGPSEPAVKTWTPEAPGFTHVPLSHVSGLPVAPADSWKLGKIRDMFNKMPHKVAPIRATPVDLGGGNIMHDVVEGHDRLAAAIEAGYTHVPVVSDQTIKRQPLFHEQKSDQGPSQVPP